MTYNPLWATAASSADVGTIQAFGRAAVPTGWLECDGSAVSRVTYATLFAVVGTTFGVGDGSTTFNVPDMRRRVPVGAGGAGTGTLGNAVGNTGGAETHTLSSAEMPSHTHIMQGPGGVELRSDAAGAGPNALPLSSTASNTDDILTSATGSGNAHNNLPPSLVVRYGIKH